MFGFKASVTVKPGRTVATIIEPLKKMAAELTTHHNTMIELSDKLLVQAKQLETESAECAHEAAEAETVRARIEALYA